MTGRSSWSIRRAAALAVVSCLCASFAVRAEVPAAEPSRKADAAVVVQAVGFATMDPDSTVEEAHRAALADARQNALSQALVDLEAQMEVVDRRVAAALVRVHTVGRIREISVADAGVVPDSDPRVYRVEIRALIAPRQPGSGLAGLPVAGWIPRVAIRLDTNAESGPGGGRLDALKRSMTACGIEVVPASAASPHLVADVSLVIEPAEGGGWARATWQVADPAAESAEAEVPPASGTWQVAGPAAPGSAEWGRLGVRLAQDALRVWLAPREASLRVTGLREEDAEALVQALRRSPSKRIERSLDDATVEAELTVAGCPVAFTQALLQRAGIEGRCAVAESTLTRTSYRAIGSSSGAAAPDASSAGD